MAILLFLLRLIGWVLLAVLLLLFVALLIPLGVRFAYRPGSVRATACYGPLHFTLWPRRGQPEALKKPASAAPPGHTVRKTADGEQASVTVEVKPDKPAAKPAQTVARQPAAQGKPEAPKPADSVPAESADAEGSAKKSSLPLGISTRIDAAMQLLSNDPMAFARCMLGHTGWLGRHLLRSVRVSGLDIFWTVTADEASTTAVKDALLAELSAIDRAPLPRAENIAMPRREPVRKVEHFDTTQAKLCMLFTLGRPMQPEQLAAVRLAMALYGGSVTSRLFLNVRERDHLCYYCSSSFQSFTGSMAVNSGVEHADAARAEQAVLKELADLCDGPITDEELEDCRRGLLAGMNGLEDTLGGIETWYYMEVLRGGPVQTPDDARRALLAVTREDVRDILKQFTLSVSCLLTREEGNENG